MRSIDLDPPRVSTLRTLSFGIDVSIRENQVLRESSRVWKVLILSDQILNRIQDLFIRIGRTHLEIIGQRLIVRSPIVHFQQLYDRHFSVHLSSP